MTPPEPNKKIEDVLQAYSKKRREQLEPGLDLHPASRKVLLQEVSQTFAQTEATAPTRKSSFGLWRWLIVGAAMAWVVFLGVYVQIPKTGSLDSSLTAPAPEVRRPNIVMAPAPAVATQPPVPAPAPSPALAKAEAPVAAPSSGNIVPPRNLRMESANEIAAKHKTEPSNASTPPAGVNLASASVPAPAPTVTSVTSETRAAAASGVAADDIKSSERREFVRVAKRSQYRENVQSPPLPKVLTAFDIERTGEKVRVTDTDGSIYEGDVMHGANATKDADGFSFQVSGRNQNLDQQIVFTGNVTGTGKQQAISGQVEVGTSSEFSIQAVPAQ